MKRVEQDYLNKNYQKIYEIGSGGFGCVYKMYSYEKNRIVAMKVIKNIQEYHNSTREAEFLLSLKNNNIIKLYNSFIVSNEIWLELEYCSYGNISFLKSKMNETLLFCIARDILKALSYIHKQDRIHFDIKPQNILVSSNYDFKLADFGISRNASSISKENVLNNGTQFYMAPELKLSGYNISSAIDIWELGMTLFEMVVGIPFTLTGAKTLDEWLLDNQHVFSSNGQQWSDNLSMLFSKMLTYDPVDRPSADSLLEESFLTTLPQTWLVVGKLIGNEKNNFWE